MSVLIVFGVFSGCGSTQRRVNPANEPQVLTSAFVISNQSRQAICYAYVSPSTERTWGTDRLGDSETIVPGTTRGWRVEPGTWDIRLQDCNRDDLLTRGAVVVSDVGIQLTYQ